MSVFGVPVSGPKDLQDSPGQERRGSLCGRGLFRGAAGRVWPGDVEDLGGKLSHFASGQPWENHGKTIGKWWFDGI